MDKIPCFKALLAGLMAIILTTNVYTQNCAGIQDLDVLNVAKKIDPVNIKNIAIVAGKIKAGAGFKFVQLRDTETYVLVPEDFQARILSIAAFLPNNSKSNVVLDKDKMTAKLVCQKDSNLKKHCKHVRISKLIVGCANCQDARWVSASVLSDVGVIIPPYRSR